MTDRDPRIDPRPGDVLGLGGCTFEVESIETVVYWRVQTPNGETRCRDVYDRGNMTRFRSEWHNAEVVECARV